MMRARCLAAACVDVGRQATAAGRPRRVTSDVATRGHALKNVFFIVHVVYF